MRTFISLDLPKQTVEELKRIQEVIEQKNLFNGKFTKSENLHLTLKFLGEIDDKKLEDVKNKLNEIKFDKFEAYFGDLGVFSKNFIKILWVKLNGKGVLELQKLIDEKLKVLFKPEYRFMSHITIARVKSVNDKNLLIDSLNKIQINKINFLVDKFYLKKSKLSLKAPKYTILSEYCLEN